MRESNNKDSVIENNCSSWRCDYNNYNNNMNNSWVNYKDRIINIIE